MNPETVIDAAFYQPEDSSILYSIVDRDEKGFHAYDLEEEEDRYFYWTDVAGDFYKLVKVEV